MSFKHMNGASEKANLVCNSIATCVDKENKIEYQRP
jgi:hypothetical protein